MINSYNAKINSEVNTEMTKVSLHSITTALENIEVQQTQTNCVASFHTGDDGIVEHCILKGTKPRHTVNTI